MFVVLLVAFLVLLVVFLVLLVAFRLVTLALLASLLRRLLANPPGYTRPQNVPRIIPWPPLPSPFPMALFHGPQWVGPTGLPRTSPTGIANDCQQLYK